LVLAVSLNAITREQDPDLALLALTCRVAEGVIGICIPTSLACSGSEPVPAPTRRTPGSARARCVPLQAGRVEVGRRHLLRRRQHADLLAAPPRPVDPVPLAWLGVAASALLVIVLPLQLAGFLAGPITSLAWLRWPPSRSRSHSGCSSKASRRRASPCRGRRPAASSGQERHQYETTGS